MPVLQDPWLSLFTHVNLFDYYPIIINHSKFQNHE